MDAIAMNAEAARCFRRACESSDPLDQTIFISLRQAWLSLAHQVERRTMARPRLILPEVALNRADIAGPGHRMRPAAAKRRKAGTMRKSSSRLRRGKLAA
jgi:hypothetical protein